MDLEKTGNDLIDLIYGALLKENDWDTFLDRLRMLVPDGKATLFFHDISARKGAFSLNAGMEEDVLRDYSAYYSSKNPWMEGAATRPMGLVVPDEYMLSRRDLQKTEFYNDYLRRFGFSAALGVTLVREEQCNFMLSVITAKPEGQAFSAASAIMQALVPHLQRAFDFYRRESLAVAALPSLAERGPSGGLATIGLDQRRCVRSRNPAAETLLGEADFIWTDLRGRFHCAEPRLTGFIDHCLAHWHRSGESPDPEMFLVGRAGHALPARVTVVVPSSNSERSYFRGPECLLLIETPDTGPADLREIKRFYALTSAETRVAAGLAAGLTVQEIAVQSRTRPDTVRVHLKQLFSKMDVHRQADVVRLIHALAGPGR